MIDPERPFVLSALLAAVLGLSLAAAEAEEKCQPKCDDAAGFQSLFNGRDLTGFDGKTDVWSVVDGAIRCQSGEKTTRNWLIWRGGTPANFELRLKFRFTNGNSGVQVRSKEIEAYQVRGYQVEIAGHDKMGLWHHSIAPVKERSHLATAGQKVHIKPDGTKLVESFGDAEEIQSACKDGQWNDLTVIAQGPRLIQKINGIVFAELIDEQDEYKAASGLIAFQDHGHSTIAEFKDIRLKKLP